MISFLISVRQPFRFLLVILYIGCIAALSLLPPQNLPKVQLFQGADKVVHFMMYLIFSVLGCWALKAEENTVDQWVNATGETWSTPNNTNRKLIKAIRLAIVARNGLLEKESVSYPCSTTHPGLCAWTGTSKSPAPTIDLSNRSDWQQYRYRVFTTIIPLRNIVWAKEALAN